MACVYNKKDHELQVIHRQGDKVIRWCGNCGAIVGDGQEDSRVYPGYYFSMAFPTIALEHRDAKIFEVIFDNGTTQILFASSESDVREKYPNVVHVTEIVIT